MGGYTKQELKSRRNPQRPTVWSIPEAFSNTRVRCSISIKPHTASTGVGGSPVGAEVWGSFVAVGRVQTEQKGVAQGEKVTVRGRKSRMKGRTGKWCSG